jgi:FKBP-type peptidyl-prolyl cis-trans isomerase FklB
MKLVAIGFITLISSTLAAQSKKELMAESAQLKAEILKLNTEITQLKKPKEISLDNEHQRASYGLGVIMASNLKNQGGDSLDLDVLSQGIKDFYENKTLKISQQECMPIVQQYMQASSEKKNEAMKKENLAFLERNKAAADVKVTASGLQYKVVSSSGSGKSPLANDNVTVHYIGKLIDGTEFDSSVKRGQPASFVLSQVIRGWTEGLQLMREGDKFIFYIPQELGYGERGAGGQIPPFSTLIFEVELIKVN